MTIPRPLLGKVWRECDGVRAAESSPRSSSAGFLPLHPSADFRLGPVFQLLQLAGVRAASHLHSDECVLVRAACDADLTLPTQTSLCWCDLCIASLHGPRKRSQMTSFFLALSSEVSRGQGDAGTGIIPLSGAPLCSLLKCGLNSQTFCHCFNLIYHVLCVLLAIAYSFYCWYCFTFARLCKTRYHGKTSV